MKIVPAQEIKQLEIIERLAWEIIPEFYAPYVPLDHCIFFVEKFQTVTAIQKQIVEGFEYYLLNYKENIAGYLGIHATNEILLLSKLYLLKEFRGKGIGDKVMSFVYKRAHELKSSTIELIVNRQNKGAIDFYEKRGFTIVQPIVSKFENGHSTEEFKMEKNIDREVHSGS
ncbi:MAG: GNAT family N-acetyltransferase [Chitinophagales bacterium]